jgi:hypothetical protein
MEPKTIMIIAVVALIIIYSAWEFIKEKSKSRKDKLQKDEQNKIFKAISEQLTENSLTNKEILKYLKISSQKYVDEITESQMRIIVESVFENSQLEIYNYASKIIRENHIKGNEKDITIKIKSFINNKFHKDSLILKEFKFQEKNIGILMKTEWRESIVENVLDSVLREKGEKSLFGSLQNCFDSLKYDMVEIVLN